MALSQYHMAKINGFCSNCHAPVQMSVGQHVKDDTLVWNLSYHCTSCGEQIQQDDIGDIPFDYRAKILHTEGEWELIVGKGNDLSLLLMSLRKALNCSLQIIKLVKDKIPGVVQKGTHAEMTRIARILTKDGIKCVVVSRVHRPSGLAE